MRVIFTLSVIIIFATSVKAQHQVYSLMERNDLSIQEIESRANRYFDSAGTGRGTGYKQFQRWLYERKFHVDENGFYISPQTEWNNYLQARTSMRAESITAANWTPIGPGGWTYTSGWNPGTGRLSAMAVHPSNQNIIYVGSPGGGVWKSVNAGSTWTPLTDNNTLLMSVFALTIDPVNQNIVYLGTSTSLLMKSIDAGLTWSPTGAGPAGTIRKVLIHPGNSNIVFAAATNGVWRSVNAGSSWTQVHTVSKEDIEFKPGDPNIMYSTGSNVIRSTDNGITWTTLGATEGITNTGRTLVSVSPANPNIVYAVQASGSLFGRLYKSIDAGLTFTTTIVGSPSAGTNFFGYESNGTGTTGQATYDMAMDVSPVDAEDVYIAGIICWRSTNGGSSFTALTQWFYPNGLGYNHADVHGLFWVGNILYSISDGGLYKSLDNGDNWTDLSTGLVIRQFYRIANSQLNPNVITGGAQDNGSVTRQLSGNWVDWLGADGMEGLVSPVNPLNIWGTSQNGSIYRSINGGASYSNLPRPAAGQWVTPLAIHPTNELIVYGGWNGVYKSVNSGLSWTNLSAGVITTTLADLAVAPSNPSYIYASNGSTLYVTADEGASWNTYTAPATINDIAVDPVDPAKIWVALNSTSNRVMVSTNAGASFTNISSNLPAIVARTVVVDDNTPRGIYVGMNIGVYYKTEADANWADYSANLPLVAVNELEIQKIAGKIRVGTYGRSIWESPVANVAPPNDFSFNSPAPVTSPCPAGPSMAITLGTVQNGTFSTPIVLSATGNPAGTTVSFSPNPVTPGGSTVVTLTGTNTLNFGSYTITVTGTAGTIVRTRDLVYTINAGTGPVISSQPANQTICAGTNTTFNISSPGATSFQWQISTDLGATYSNLVNGSVYAGVNTNTLSVTGAIIGMNNYQYRNIASSLCGSSTSNAAILTVNAAPAIVTQPQDITICAGNNHSFNVAANGTAPTYQWQISTNGCTGPWTNIAGATSSTYTLNSITAAQNGNAFRVVVSGSCNPAVTSNCALLNVVTAVSVTSHPVSQTTCVGSATTFNVSGSGSGIVYQWQISTDGGATYNNIPGATASSYVISSVTAAMNNNRYRAQLSNPSCITPGISNAAILTVNLLTAIGAQPQDATVCSGSAASLCVAAAGTNLVYQWETAPVCSGAFANIPGATSACLNILNANATAVYRVKITGACGTTMTSDCKIVTVVAPVSITLQPSNKEICSGSNTSFTVAATSSETINYQWESSNDGGSTWNIVPGANTNTLSLTAVTTAMNNIRYRARLTNTSCSSPVYSTPALLTVRQLPSVNLVASPLTSLLPGQSTTLTANPTSSTGGTLTTSWIKNTNPFNNNSNNFLVNIENTGSYQLRIEERFASGLVCSNQSPVVVIDAAVSNNLFIFPSPNDGQFTVSYHNSSGNNDSRTVNVFDSKGAKIYQGKFAIAGSYTLLRVDLRPAQPGIYFVVVGDALGNKLAEGKLLVH